MIAALCAFSVLAVPQDPAPWTINLDALSEKKFVYDVEVALSAQGETASATMSMAIAFPKFAAGAKPKVSVEWQDLAVDGQSVGTQGPWEVVMAQNGVIEDATDGDDFRRMLMPITPVFGTDIKVGGEWSVNHTPKANATQTVEWKLKAVAIEKIGDVETLKITAKMTEKGGTSSDGTWWLRKDGRFQKFELDVKQWTVPMAGEAFDAKVKGKLRT